MQYFSTQLSCQPFEAAAIRQDDIYTLVHPRNVALRPHVFFLLVDLTLLYFVIFVDTKQIVEIKANCFVIRSHPMCGIGCTHPI